MNMNVRAEGLQSYHHAWLKSHPWRSEEWLKARLRDGFQIHHIDGNHGNDDPANLLLVDGDDHMRLHGVSIESGIEAWRRIDRKREAFKDEARAIYEAKAGFNGTWGAFAQERFGGVKPSSQPWTDIGSGLSNKARNYAKAEGLPWPPTNPE